MSAQEKSIDQLLQKLQGFQTTPPTPEQLQQIAGELWSLETADDVDSSSRPAPPGSATAKLHQAFLIFGSLMDSISRIDESLVGPFTGLTQNHATLIKLRARGFWSNAQVQVVQELVNEIENKWNAGETRFGGDQSSIPMGQAVMSSLLHHIHRLEQWMLERNDPVNKFLQPVHEKLVTINHELDSILLLPGDESLAKMDRVADLQRELIAIDQSRSKNDGVFVPEDAWEKLKIESPGSIPEGQSECRALLESAFEKAYELVCQSDNAGKLSSMEAEKTLLKGFSIEQLKDYITSNSRNLTDAVKDEVSSIGRNLSLAYTYLSDLTWQNLSVHEAVDPRLTNIQQELYSILSGLKSCRLRLIQNKGKFVDDAGKVSLLQFRDRLNQVDGRRVDGRFVGDDGAFAPAGQAALMCTMDECYSILTELNRIES